MKKVMVLTSVLALAACGFSADEIAKYDANFEGCERVDTNKIHLVYKCPSDQAWLAEIKKQEPNSLFMTGGGLKWDDVNADTKHTYVEVVKGASNCEENVYYRVMIKPFNTETREFFAVDLCK